MKNDTCGRLVCINNPSQIFIAVFCTLHVSTIDLFCYTELLRRVPARHNDELLRRDENVSMTWLEGCLIYGLLTSDEDLAEFINSQTRFDGDEQGRCRNLEYIAANCPIATILEANLHPNLDVPNPPHAC